MAKETKKTTETAVVAKDIREELDSASVGNLELSNAVQEIVNKEKNERTQREMKERYMKASFRVDEVKENQKYQGDLTKIAKNELVQVSRLCRFMMGFVFDPEDKDQIFKHAAETPDIFGKEEINLKDKTITVVMIGGEKKTFKAGETVPPIIDYVDYDNLYEKINENRRKLTKEADDRHRTYRKKLDAKYGEYWNSSWRY